MAKRRNTFIDKELNANGKIREAISPRRAVQKRACIGKLLFFFPHPPVGSHGRQNPGTASRSTVLGKLPRKPFPRLPSPPLGSKTRGEHWGGTGLRGTTLRGLRGHPANLGGGSAGRLRGMPFGGLKAEGSQEAGTLGQLAFRGLPPTFEGEGLRAFAGFP